MTKQLEAGGGASRGATGRRANHGLLRHESRLEVWRGPAAREGVSGSSLLLLLLRWVLSWQTSTSVCGECRPRGEGAGAQVAGAQRATGGSDARPGAGPVRAPSSLLGPGLGRLVSPRPSEGSWGAAGQEWRWGADARSRAGRRPGLRRTFPVAAGPGVRVTRSARALGSRRCGEARRPRAPSVPPRSRVPPSPPAQRLRCCLSA